MALATLLEPEAAAKSGLPAPVRMLLLARLIGERGAARGEALRDLASLLPAKLGARDCKDVLATGVAELVAGGLVAQSGQRLALTAAGQAAAGAALGVKALPKSWTEARATHLTARALGAEAQAARKIKLLAKPDALRTAVVQTAFGLPARAAASTSRMRTALAAIALERAFGNKVKGDLASGKGLSAKAARQLAGQLARKPREFGTDSRLIAQLAADHVGITDTDAEAVRSALIRGYVQRSLSPQPPATPQRVALAPSPPAAAPTPSAPPAPARPAAAARPDLAGFAQRVQAAARTRAEGWSGNRKAFISHVWAVIGASHPEWGLTAIEFKAMLAEAHRTGHLLLAGADLKDKSQIKDFQESAIAYKNTVWHFIRIED